MRLLGLFFVLVLLSGCGPKATVYPERIVFPPLEYNLPQVDNRTLASGARLYTKEDHELPLVEITIMVPGGAIDDPQGFEGQAALLAAALRGGGFGERAPEDVDRLLENKAANLSISASRYVTTLRLSLRAEDLDFALQLVSDIFQRPRFNRDRFAVARNQMIEGVRRQNDDPRAIAQRLIKKAVYGDHPLGRTATVKSLNTIRYQQVVDRFRAMLNARNLWIGVSGDFDTETLEKKVDGILSSWPVPSVSLEQAPEPLSTETAPKLWLIDKSIPQTTIVMGSVGIDKSAPDLHAVRVMNSILGGGGFNSHLMREVRSNRGLAYSVYSYFQLGRKLPGLFVAGAETKTSSTVEVMTLMRDLIDAMHKEPVSETELALAKDSLINSFIFAFEGTHAVVEQQMRLDYYGYPADYMTTYRSKVAAVTAQDVLAAAKSHLKVNDLSMILVGDCGKILPTLREAGLPYDDLRCREE